MEFESYFKGYGERVESVKNGELGLLDPFTSIYIKIILSKVTGELSNNGQPMRRFMQTFVLVPQSPKKYYVHNDIFRYQDEVFHDNDTDTENQEDVIGINIFILLKYETKFAANMFLVPKSSQFWAACTESNTSISLHRSCIFFGEKLPLFEFNLISMWCNNHGILL